MKDLFRVSEVDGVGNVCDQCRRRLPIERSLLVEVILQ